MLSLLFKSEQFPVNGKTEIQKSSYSNETISQFCHATKNLRQKKTSENIEKLQLKTKRKTQILPQNRNKKCFNKTKFGLNKIRERKCVNSSTELIKISWMSEGQLATVMSTRSMQVADWDFEIESVSLLSVSIAVGCRESAHSQATTWLCLYWVNSSFTREFRQQYTGRGDWQPERGNNRTYGMTVAAHCHNEMWELLWAERNLWPRLDRQYRYRFNSRPLSVRTVCVYLSEVWLSALKLNLVELISALITLLLTKCCASRESYEANNNVLLFFPMKTMKANIERKQHSVIAGKMYL